jgi:hypothetical protein
MREQTPEIPRLYNETITIHRHGPLDVSILRKCLATIISRHEIWRTSFVELDGEPVQVVHPAPDAISVPVIDLTGFTDAVRDAEATRLANEDARRPFNLARGPLVRALLLKLDERSYRLCMTIHQIILDGVSVYQVLLPELAELYAAYSAGRAPHLAELPVQFADFAMWQRETLTPEAVERQLSYWRKQLVPPLPVLPWPNQRPRPALQTFRGAIEPFTVSPEVAERLRALSRTEGVTLFSSALACFTLVLHCYTGQQDLIIGTVSPAGRKHSEVQRLMGYFLNPVPLRMRLHTTSTVRDMLRQARLVTSEALTNDDLPVEQIAEQLGLEKDPSRNPLFNVAISLEPPLASLEAGWDLTPMDAESGGARWDLYFVLDDRKDGMLGRVQYNPDLIAPSSIRRLIADFESVVRRTAVDPSQTVAQIRRGR